MQQSHFSFGLLSAIASLFLASCTPSVTAPDSEAPPVPEGLSAEQEASLREVGIPVAVPAYVPEGFQVSEVIANSCAEGSPQTGACREGPHYTIVYRNPQNTCLLVNGIGGGVGGGAAEFEFSTQSELLGEVTILFGDYSGANQAPTAEQLSTPQESLYSFPAAAPGSNTPFYNVSVEDSDYGRETYGCGANTSVTPADLEQVVQSLALLE